MVDINRKTFRDIDWLLLLTPVALTLLGCVGIHSTAPGAETKKQLIALGIGLVAAIIVMFTDYRKIIINGAPFIYAAVMVLLVLVLFMGKEINGNKAWLHVAGFSLQPSEFAKAATILMLARHMAQPRIGSPAAPRCTRPAPGMSPPPTRRRGPSAATLFRLRPVRWTISASRPRPMRTAR